MSHTGTQRERDRVIWHELECGSYRADLPLWRELADSAGGALLEIGAGSGRVALELARAGHAVTALDRDAALLAALAARAEGLDVQVVCADARRFSLRRRFALVLVPMQTIQLLGGAAGRAAFLRCARAHLRPGGTLAIALATVIEPFELLDGTAGPAPEIGRRPWGVYKSQPTAVRVRTDRVELERRRELIAPDGGCRVELDRLSLDRLSALTLEREGERCGLARRAIRTIAPTREHVGSEVVILGG